MVPFIFTYDLRFSMLWPLCNHILGHIVLSTCWAKHLQIFTQASLGYGHSLGAKNP